MANESISGAAQGAAAGSAFGPVGSVIGGGIGFLTGLQAESKSRDVYRAQRQQERLNNEALITQARVTGEGATRLSATQRAAFGAAGVAGATPAALSLDSVFQSYRDQLALLAGVTANFQGRTERNLVQKYGDEWKRVGKRVNKEFNRVLDDIGDFFDGLF